MPKTSIAAPTGSVAAPVSAITPLLPTSTPGVMMPWTARSAAIVVKPARITIRASLRRAALVSRTTAAAADEGGASDAVGCTHIGGITIAPPHARGRRPAGRTWPPEEAGPIRESGGASGVIGRERSKLKRAVRRASVALVTLCYKPKRR